MTRLEITGRYTDDWHAISLATRDEAGWRCVRCRHAFSAAGAPCLCDDGCDRTRGRLTYTDATGRITATLRHNWWTPGFNYGVHHLDGDKGNNRWWNRLATCNSCHLSIQARVIPERLYALPHAPWFIPFVCGYFAHAAGIEITRVDALADPHRFLAMGQPWLYEDAAVRA